MNFLTSILRDKKSFILLILLIISIVYISVDFYNGNQQQKAAAEQQRLLESYRQGVQDANNLILQQMIQQLNNQGFVTLTVPTNDGKTTTIRLGIIQPNQP
ncbi:hypothetical protein HYX17_04915 [Candidatus Woesearchaeota archaeon]|nr:hypothetical protein [Candidatus Woesearchaeota archaeon]